MYYNYQEVIYKIYKKQEKMIFIFVQKLLNEELQSNVQEQPKENKHLGRRGRKKNSSATRSIPQKTCDPFVLYKYVLTTHCDSCIKYT